MAWELPSILSDHLVWQRGCEAAIWGWDEPGQVVVVSFRGKRADTSADEKGYWRVRIPSGKAGGPFELAIEGSRSVVLKDVLVGEVWIAGGQSNMWWALRRTTNAEAEIAAAAEKPQVRIYNTNTGPRDAGWPESEPQRNVATAWTVPTTENAGGLPSTAYFFARSLHEALGVPVGIVHTAVPGTPIEKHLSPAKVAELGLKTETRDDQPQVPAVLFNGGIAPVVPYTARGFIWWQGEGNQHNPEQYRQRFLALIEDWRRHWGAAEMPFLYVELHGFGPLSESPVEEASFPKVRDAQREALALDGVYAVPVPDILDEAEWEIHPPKKQLAGHRLAQTALAAVYADGGALPPRVAGVSFSGSTVTLTYAHAQELHLEKKGVSGYALAGHDRKWQHAEATLCGNTVILHSNEVAEPAALRFGFVNHSPSHLYNEAKLAAGQFRSDQWNFQE